MRRGDEFDRAVRSGIRTGRDTVVIHVVWGRSDVSVHPQSGDEAVDESCEQASDRTRVGFVVSRAVGPAVVRARVKRRLRHVMRERVSRFPARSLVVVRATPRAAGASSSTLAADVDRLIESVTRKAGREVPARIARPRTGGAST
jgi:ribonuclease P protein component